MIFSTPFNVILFNYLQFDLWALGFQYIGTIFPPRHSSPFGLWQEELVDILNPAPAWSSASGFCACVSFLDLDWFGLDQRSSAFQRSLVTSQCVGKNCYSPTTCPFFFFFYEFHTSLRSSQPLLYPVTGGGWCKLVRDGVSVLWFEGLCSITWLVGWFWRAL